MFQSRQEFDTAMKSVLNQIKSGKDIDSIITDKDMAEAVAECVSQGYLRGIECNRNADGNPLIDAYNPQITYSGLAFIEIA